VLVEGSGGRGCIRAAAAATRYLLDRGRRARFPPASATYVHPPIAIMRKRLARWLPSEEGLLANRSLRFLRPLLRRPWLWQLSRRRVAAGAAIGVFFGFAIPVLQIACAAALAVVLRANLPVAAVATLVSNPFTYVPIYAAAYKAGAVLLGEEVHPARAAAVAEAQAAERGVRSWTTRALEVGKPLALGLGLFAVAGAALAWLAVNLLRRAAVALRRRERRRSARGSRPG
jgi:uncharacterized protein (DUF2062 family)